jgi:hypothetical protein
MPAGFSSTATWSSSLQCALRCKLWRFGFRILGLGPNSVTRILHNLCPVPRLLQALDKPFLWRALFRHHIVAPRNERRRRHHDGFHTPAIQPEFDAAVVQQIELQIPAISASSQYIAYYSVRPVHRLYRVLSVTAGYLE